MGLWKNSLLNLMFHSLALPILNLLVPYTSCRTSQNFCLTLTFQKLIFQWKPVTNVEKCFLFHLKGSFRSQYN